MPSSPASSCNLGCNSTPACAASRSGSPDLGAATWHKAFGDFGGPGRRNRTAPPWLNARVDSPAVRLQLLGQQHARSLERFERSNRAFFAATIGDRGEDFFTRFDELLAARVAENEQGTSLLFVLVEAFNEVIGRINVLDIDQPELAELGFRVAEHAQGNGLATRGVTEALEVAAQSGVSGVKARAAASNIGSQRVLQRCGFVPTGAAEAPAGTRESFQGFWRDLSQPS